VNRPQTISYREPPIIRLPAPQLEGKISLEQILAQRRSVRHFARRPLTPEQVSQLLWAAQGITGNSPELRTAPSAGGRHPLEFYLCREDGVWHYEPERHLLIQHMERDIRGLLGQAAWKQTFIGEAPCVFVVSAAFQRTTTKYGERGRIRYVPMDLGHATENLLLQAVALGLGAVSIAAFDDNAVTETLRLPKTEDPLYLIPTGYPA
jgi:SagB-type dehydrogenase family enzyme